MVLSDQPRLLTLMNVCPSSESILSNAWGSFVYDECESITERTVNDGQVCRSQHEMSVARTLSQPNLSTGALALDEGKTGHVASLLRTRTRNSVIAAPATWNLVTHEFG